MTRCVCIFGSLLILWLPACNRQDPPPNAQAQAADDGHGHDAHSDDEHADHDHDHDAHANEVRLTADAIARYGVKVEEASLWNLRPTFTAPARIAFNSEAMAHVGSPLPGRVIDIKARLGERVRQGDALIIVESPELGEAQADYFEKRVAADAAGPAAELAKAAWERAKEVFEQTRGISLTEVQRREAEYKAAAAAQRSAQASVVAAENRLLLLGMSQEAVTALTSSGAIDPRFTINAPVNGQVIDREVTLGELVSPEHDSLMVLADTESLWVLADVPEARLAEIALGARAWIRAGELDPHQHEGEVSHIASMVDAQTRSAAVRIVVECEDQTLKPGMFVQVEIASSDRADPNPPPMVAVLEGAVQTIDGRPVIFVPVPNEENTFTPREVSIGKPIGGLLPVHAGLVEGERLVTSGSFILKAELGKGTAEHSH